MRKDKPDQKDKKKVQEGSDMIEQVLQIKRVSKKTPGGNYISFTALVVVGDRAGKVGIGFKRGLEVPQAIKKAIAYAKKHMIEVPIEGKTLPNSFTVKYKAAKIMLKPAPAGTGLKVGGVVRTILSIAGYENASGKILKSRNHLSNAYAVMKGLSKYAKS